jgi:hypothetical protein
MARDQADEDDQQNDNADTRSKRLVQRLEKGRHDISPSVQSLKKL